MAEMWAVASSASMRLVIILATLAIMVRHKIRIGRVLMFAPVLAAVLFASGRLPAAFWHTVTADGAAFIIKTAVLISLVALINFFGGMLKETEKLPRLMQALLSVFSDARIALAGMPALVGLLPMPGGALLSAPMVEEVAGTVDRPVSAEDKSLVNYLFRHVWEYFLPVYPAVLMSVVIWEIGFGQVIANQLVLTFSAIAGALFFVLRPIGVLRVREGAVAGTGDAVGGHVRAIIGGVFPIAAVFGLWYVLGLIGTGAPDWAEPIVVIRWAPWRRVSLVIALVLINAALVRFYHVPAERVRHHLRRCLPLDMFLLMLGAMLFQGVVESAGAVSMLAGELEAIHVPLVAVVFALPFAAGMLSGIAVFYVTVAFPILTGLIAVGRGYDAAAMVLAYASGYAGVLLSPVHLCLLLTVQHFNANMGAVYRRLFLPVGGTLCVALVVYFTTTQL